MLGQRVAGGHESGSGMALLATVAPRFAGKLALVLILVAICAKRKLDSVARFLAGRNMAIGAFHFCMG